MRRKAQVGDLHGKDIIHKMQHDIQLMKDVSELDNLIYQDITVDSNLFLYKNHQYFIKEPYVSVVDLATKKIIFPNGSTMPIVVNNPEVMKDIYTVTNYLSNESNNYSLTYMIINSANYYPFLFDAHEFRFDYLNLSQGNYYGMKYEIQGCTQEDWYNYIKKIYNTLWFILTFTNVYMRDIITPTLNSKKKKYKKEKYGIIVFGFGMKYNFYNLEVKNYKIKEWNRSFNALNNIMKPEDRR